MDSRDWDRYRDRGGRLQLRQASMVADGDRHRQRSGSRCLCPNQGFWFQRTICPAQGRSGIISTEKALRDHDFTRIPFVSLAIPAGTFLRNFVDTHFWRASWTPTFATGANSLWRASWTPTFATGANSLLDCAGGLRTGDFIRPKDFVDTHFGGICRHPHLDWC